MFTRDEVQGLVSVIKYGQGPDFQPIRSPNPALLVSARRARGCTIVSNSFMQQTFTKRTNDYVDT
jgi:hypothetical protein